VGKQKGSREYEERKNPNNPVPIPIVAVGKGQKKGMNLGCKKQA